MSYDQQPPKQRPPACPVCGAALRSSGDVILCSNTLCSVRWIEKLFWTLYTRKEVS